MVLSILVLSGLLLLGKPIRCARSCDFPRALTLHATGSICARTILLMEHRMVRRDRLYLCTCCPGLLKRRRAIAGVLWQTEVIFDPASVQKYSQYARQYIEIRSFKTS